MVRLAREHPEATASATGGSLWWQWGVLAGLVLFGVSLIVGAIRDWDWLYAPDGEYHNNWSLGQVSRYLGRDIARVIGLGGGVALLAIAAMLAIGAVKTMFTRGLS